MFVIKASEITKISKPIKAAKKDKAVKKYCPCCKQLITIKP
jgi:hypothetical protein